MHQKQCEFQNKTLSHIKQLQYLARKEWIASINKKKISRCKK